MPSDLSDDTYILDGRDRSIVTAMKKLLWKLVRSELLSAGQLEHVARVVGALDRLPAPSGEMEVAIRLVGPKRRFGEHEIYHFWDIEVEGDCINLTTGGYFYRPSTGGDSFTALRWSALPGFDAELEDYLDALGLVDDAKPFEEEVQGIDLRDGRYTVTVEADGEDIPGLGREGVEDVSDGADS